MEMRENSIYYVTMATLFGHVFYFTPAATSFIDQSI